MQTIAYGLTTVEEQIEGETGCSGSHWRHLVKAAQCLEPDVLVHVIAAIQEQMTAVARNLIVSHSGNANRRAGLADGVFAEPEELVIGLLERIPVVKAEDDNGVTAILAVELVVARRL